VGGRSLAYQRGARIGAELEEARTHLLVTAVARRGASRFKLVASHPVKAWTSPVGGQDPPPAGRGERGDETLREHPVHMQDIRVELSDEAAHRPAGGQWPPSRPGGR
jgi:hypothetical protein